MRRLPPIFLLLLLLPACYDLTQKKETYVAEAKNSMVFPRGIRLSNPGNIKRNDIEWQGMTRLQDDKVFVRFSSPYHGIRALTKLLINYKRLHDCDTITLIIARYAPTTENNTASYIRNVSTRTGFFPNELLNMEDIDTLVKIAQAITIHENGFPPVELPANWFDDDVYYSAAEDALDEDYYGTSP